MKRPNKKKALSNQQIKKLVDSSLRSRVIRSAQKIDQMISELNSPPATSPTIDIFAEHRTSKLEIKPAVIADIDDGIRPLVEWLNRLYGVDTEWSCQGDFTPPLNHYAYVVFYCTDINSLAVIAGTLKPSILNCELYQGNLRFIIRMERKHEFDEVIERTGISYKGIKKADDN